MMENGLLQSLHVGAASDSSVAGMSGMYSTENKHPICNAWGGDDGEARTTHACTRCGYSHLLIILERGWGCQVVVHHAADDVVLAAGHGHNHLAGNVNGDVDLGTTGVLILGAHLRRQCQCRDGTGDRIALIEGRNGDVRQRDRHAMHEELTYIRTGVVGVWR